MLSKTPPSAVLSKTHGRHKEEKKKKPSSFLQQRNPAVGKENQNHMELQGIVTILDQALILHKILHVWSNMTPKFFFLFVLPWILPSDSSATLFLKKGKRQQHHQGAQPRIRRQHLFLEQPHADRHVTQPDPFQAVSCSVNSPLVASGLG